MSTIYDRIRARRLELGLTAEDLAQQLGYKDKSSISKIENGKADIPQAKVDDRRTTVTGRIRSAAAPHDSAE